MGELVGIYGLVHGPQATLFVDNGKELLFVIIKTGNLFGEQIFQQATQVDIWRDKIKGGQFQNIPCHLFRGILLVKFADNILVQFILSKQGASDGPQWFQPTQSGNLLFNDVQVERAGQPFTHGGVDYPRGTYLVWLDQPKRGLANTVLDDGLDLSDVVGPTFYSPPSVWSHPRLWGVARAVMDDAIDISTHAITKAATPAGSIESGAAVAHGYLPTSLAAIQATKQMISKAMEIGR